MSADDSNGDASKSRDIPEYVQRNFKLHRSLGIDGAEKTTAGHQAAPRSFLSNGPRDSSLAVEDRGVIKAAPKEASSAGTTSYRGYIDRQSSGTPQTSSAAIAMYKAYTSERDSTPTPTSTAPLFQSHSFNGHPPCGQLSEWAQKSLPIRTSADPRDGNLVSSEGQGNGHTTQQPNVRLQQYADEVYQNTVVKYQERVRRGEEKVPTDQDRRNNRTWIANYRAWMARQKADRDVDEGFSKPQQPRKGG
ncbi:hypothetical protein IWX90DRAFT_487740 [Phyllosticta citrichinensis]|uniref:Uncharacterized protein n=1 Tax=Phyllosticta citrichinensis TaxID=1130410 RepID=A0ABR1XS47_9PEZI